MARQNVKLSFPMKGIVEVTSYADQPADTTFDTLNVRPHDSLKARLRGGQRAGLAKYISAAVNGSNPIQQVRSVALAFDSTAVEATSTPLDRDFDADISTDGDLTDVDPGIWETWTDRFSSRSEDTNCEIQIGDSAGGADRGAYVLDACANAWTEAVYAGPAITLGSKYILTATVQLTTPSPTGNPHPIMWRVDTASRNRLSIRVDIFSGDLRIRPFVLTAGSDAAGTIDSGTTIVSGLTNTDPQEVQIQANGNVFTCWVNGSQIWTWTNTSFSSSTDVGFSSYETTSGEGVVQKFKIQLAETPASLRTVKLVVASGGNLYDGNAIDGLTILGSGTAAVVASGEVWIESAFQQGYTADGLSTGYNIVNLKTRVVSDWQTAVTVGALPVGGTGTANSITAVDTGAKTFTVAEDLSALVAGDFIEVRDSTGNDKSYTVASDSGSGPTVITVNETIPDATVDGDLYTGTVACRFAALFRGRIVLAGLESDPQNWFMSRAEEPLDWDYFPAVFDVKQAVAGNTNQAGRLEDIVTALMPYLDDVLYVGGDHTIWVLAGDPAEQGVFDNVSRQIGIVGPEAFTFDTTSNMYFLAQNGLYRLKAGSTQVESISRGRLDDTLSSLDFAANRIRLQYDREWQGVHIFVTPTSQPSTSPSHYFWDERTNSFWRDEYPPAHGPTAVHLFDADSADDRAVILGGFDSVLRFFDRTSKNDDGTLIDSFVNFTPLVAGDRGQVLLTETQINLAEGSDSNAILKVFAAGTAENAAAQTVPKAAKALTEGRNQPLIARVKDNTIVIQIRDNTLGSTWAYESGSIIVDGAGVIRSEESD